MSWEFAGRMIDAFLCFGSTFIIMYVVTFLVARTILFLLGRVESIRR